MTSRPPMKASMLLATLRLGERPGPHCIELHYGTFPDAMVRKQSNKRSGARLKTDSKTEERCVTLLLRYAKPILRKKPPVLQSIATKNLFKFYSAPICDATRLLYTLDRSF